jgi:hypothetical protein
LCPFDKCGNAAEAFGLHESDLPRAVVDDTNSGRKIIQPHDEFDLSAEEVLRFWDSSLNQLQ